MATRRVFKKPSSLENLTTLGTATESEGLDSLFWPAPHLGQAIEDLARKGGLLVSTRKRGTVPEYPSTIDDEALERWVDSLSNFMGLEAEPVQSTYAETGQFLRRGGPILLKVTGGEKESEPRFIALLKGGRRQVHLIAPDRSVHRVRREVLQDALWSEHLQTCAPMIEQMLVNAHVPEARRSQAHRAILKELLGPTTHQSGWLLRLPPSANLWHQTRQAGLLRSLGMLVAAYWIQLLLIIVAWWMIGQRALVGHFDWGWLLGWGLLLLTTLPFQAQIQLRQSQLATALGGIFKQRLLYGVLQLEPEEVRYQGAGQFLGRVLAADRVEQLGMASGFVAILALFQVGMSGAILAAGAGGWPHALLLLFWVLVTLGLSGWYLYRSQAWVDAHREMTNDLVERMAGHRTRLAQEDPTQWHEEEDQVLADYLQLQHKVDGVESQLKALVPRGWMVLGLGGILYGYLFAHPTPAHLAISIGGILFAHQALTSIVLGLKSLVGARLAWQEVGMLFHAATRTQISGKSSVHPTSLQAWQNRQPDESADNPIEKAPLLTAREVNFGYTNRGRLALQACNLQIHQGDRLLLEGPSGGGKSTLARVLAGLNMPDSGMLLLCDVEQQMLGTVNWRQSVVAVPQFYENYVLTGSLAFNLLMGRRWPPQPQDLEEAEQLCRELGLDALLDRMPAGLQQMVGESGWQLSHGERSRLYIARAILQRASLVILDESFGALDPQSLQQVLDCVLARAPTLLVIAHP